MKYKDSMLGKKTSFEIDKIKNNPRKKGSALILMILLLGFFTATALNIYYWGEKKGEEAYDKVEGEKVTNYIDIASSIGYQELALAENFVRKGFVYDNSHPASKASYSYPKSDIFYLSDGGTYSSKFSGIQLNNFAEYFNSHWDYKLEDDNGTTEDEQKLILSETVVGGEVDSREWQSGGVPTKMLKLWEVTEDEDAASRVSIGGYRLTDLFLTNLTDGGYEDKVNLESDVKSSIESELGDVGDEYLMRAVFEKTVRLDEFKEGGEVKISETKFLVRVEEEVIFDTDEGKDLITQAKFYDGKIAMEIEKLN